MLCPNTMMESLGLAKLVEENIIAQQCSKSVFIPFRNMVPQRPQILSANRTTPIKLLEPLLSSIYLNPRCRNIEKKGFVIIVMRNSPRDIDVLSKRSISWMWLLRLHLKFVKMLRIQYMIMSAFNRYLLTLLLMMTSQIYLSLHQLESPPHNPCGSRVSSRTSLL